MKPIDKSKKSNICCDHCTHFENPYNNNLNCFCTLTMCEKHYWNRCKSFVWREDREYKEATK